MAIETGDAGKVFAFGWLLVTSLVGVLLLIISCVRSDRRHLSRPLGPGAA